MCDDGNSKVGNPEFIVGAGGKNEVIKGESENAVDGDEKTLSDGGGVIYDGVGGEAVPTDG